jgi:hypothetical protein
MKWLFTIVISSFLISGLSAQEVNSTKESRKEASRRKKEIKQAKIDSEYRATDTLLVAKRFVLEAQYLSNSRGSRVLVTQNLNFISVDSDYAIVQVGSPQRAGVNGVGGVTVQGRVSNWKFSKDDRRKNFNLFLTVQTNSGIYDINISVDYSANADATITGLRSGSLKLSGTIVAQEDSLIFKGQSR